MSAPRRRAHEPTGKSQLQSYRDPFRAIPARADTVGEAGGPPLPTPAALLARADALAQSLGADGTGLAGDPSLEAARRAQDGSRPGEAVAILCALLRDPARAGEGALGLAVLALGQEDLADADAFARFCLDRGERTARACAVAGVAALERGDKADAQRLLSAAARIARTGREAADDLRGAQRVLLLMQLGTP